MTRSPFACVAVIMIGISASAFAQEDQTAPSAVLSGCPDPAVIECRDGTGYYIFSTGKGCVIRHSTDLTDWKPIGRVFDTPVPPWAREMIPKSSGIWAPDIVYFSGKYHLYYSVSSFGSQRSVIGLAVNETLDPTSDKYKWEDRGLVIESSPEMTDFNAIDPAMFVDNDGPPYLFWGSYWTGIKAVQLDPATGKPSPVCSQIVPIAARAEEKRPPAIEAPYVVYRDGYYYLFVSWDFCCDGAKSTYKVMVGRSKNVLGPYVDFRGKPMPEGGGTLVLQSHERWAGPGHNSILSTEEGDWLVHHVYDVDHVRAGRVLQIRPMYWLENGWPVVGEPIDLYGETPDMTPFEGCPAATWRHTVDYRHPSTIRLETDGTISRAGGRAKWTQDGDMLELSWPSDEAPGGFWRDRVLIEPSGNSYIGRNQRGHIIRGIREAADHPE